MRIPIPTIATAQAEDRAKFEACRRAKELRNVQVVQMKQIIHTALCVDTDQTHAFRTKDAQEVPREPNGRFLDDEGWSVVVVAQLMKPATVELRYEGGYSEVVHL